MILLPEPAYITEYKAEPLETVFIGGLEITFALFTSVIGSLRSIRCTADVVVTDLTVASGVDVTVGKTFNGNAFAGTLSALAVFFLLGGWGGAKMHGSIENADFGRPELL